jgi:hypothetical protein
MAKFEDMLKCHIVSLYKWFFMDFLKKMAQIHKILKIFKFF